MMIKWLITQIFYSVVLAGLMFIGWLICYAGVVIGIL